MQRSPSVARDDAGGVGTRGDEESQRGDVRGTDAHERDVDVPQRLVDHLERIGECGDDDGSGALLVVVPHRYPQRRAETLEGLEARRLSDVLEIDATERGLEVLDQGHQLVDRRRLDTDRNRVDATEVLEEQRLALHHRQPGLWTDVAEAEDAGAVGHDGDRVRLVGVLEDQTWVCRHCTARCRNARRVPDGEVAELANRDLRNHLHLAAIERVQPHRLRRLISCTRGTRPCVHRFGRSCAASV